MANYDFNNINIEKVLNRIKWNKIITAVLGIIMGIMFLSNPAASTIAVCIVAGIVLVADGIVSIANYIAIGHRLGGHGLITGIALEAAGIFCMTHPELVSNMLPVIFGLYVVADGCGLITQSIECKNAKISGWGWILALAIINIILGCFVMFSGTAAFVILVSGFCLIFNGISELVTFLVFKDKIRKAKEFLSKNHETIYID